MMPYSGAGFQGHVTVTEAPPSTTPTLTEVADQNCGANAG